MESNIFFNYPEAHSCCHGYEQRFRKDEEDGRRFESHLQEDYKSLGCCCHQEWCNFLCSKLCLIFQISWFCSKSISTTGTPQTFPLYEYFTNLTSLLPTYVSARTYRFLRFVTNTYTFTCHLLFTLSYRTKLVFKFS